MKSAGFKNLLGCRAAFIALLAIGAVGVFPVTPVHAQDATLPTKEVNITLNDAPVRTALDTLFKSAGLNYTIDPGVTGLVTVSLRAIPFDVALRSILRSSEPPLAFTVTDGVYDIHPRDSQINIQPTGSNSGGPAPVEAAAPTPDQSTSTQVVPLRLEYANASLILRYALSGSNTGYIPSLDAPPTSGGMGQSGGMGGMNGMSGGMGGMGGMSGMSGMGGMSGMSGMGGMSGGYGGMSGGMGGMSGGYGGMSGGYGR